MKTVYDQQLILDALNKYTQYQWNVDDSMVFSTNDHLYGFEVVEVSHGLFALDECRRDTETGTWDNFVLLREESLADIINEINE